VKLKILLVSVLVAVVAVGAGLYYYRSVQQSREREAYLSATRSADDAVLRQYLQLYPDAPQAHRDSIALLLTRSDSVEMAWQSAFQQREPRRLYALIASHPSSPHVSRARRLIDTLDYKEAVRARTPEALQAYLDRHAADGAFLDAVRSQLAALDGAQLTVDERNAVRDVVNRFFAAIVTRSDSAIVATVATPLASFMGVSQATVADVRTYVATLYKPDVKQLSIAVAEDWNISKRTARRDTVSHPFYRVAVSIDVSTEHSEREPRHELSTYRVFADVSSDFKIQAYNTQHLPDE